MAIDDEAISAEAMQQAEKLLHSEYGRVAIAKYVENWLGESGVCYSKDMELQDDKAYVMSLLTVLVSSDRGAQYTVKELGGIFSNNQYSIPQLQINRKEGKK